MSYAQPTVPRSKFKRYLDLMFCPRGPVNRVHYLLAHLSLLGWLIVLGVIWSLAMVVPLMGTKSPVQTAVSVGLAYLPILGLSLYCHVVLSIKRLWHCGRSAYWCLLFLLPWVNIVFNLYLYVWPGKKQLQAQLGGANPFANWQ